MNGTPGILHAEKKGQPESRTYRLADCNHSLLGPFRAKGMRWILPCQSPNPSCSCRAGWRPERQDQGTKDWLDSPFFHHLLLHCRPLPKSFRTPSMLLVYIPSTSCGRAVLENPGKSQEVKPLAHVPQGPSVTGPWSYCKVMVLSVLVLV